MIQNLEDNKLHIGDRAPEFELPGTDGKTYTLSSFEDASIFIVAFTCNHCPYVQAYEDRIISLQQDYGEKGVRLVAINSNDERGYPEDSYDNMVIRARAKGFNFPYLRDKAQEAAREFGAQCTPEFFVFDNVRKLRYHGRIDDNWQFPENVTSHDMREALDAILNGSPVRKPENSAIGCSIKWEMA